MRTQSASQNCSALLNPVPLISVLQFNYVNKDELSSMERFVNEYCSSRRIGVDRMKNAIESDLFTVLNVDSKNKKIRHVPDILEGIRLPGEEDMSISEIIRTKTHFAPESEEVDVIASPKEREVFKWLGIESGLYSLTRRVRRDLLAKAFLCCYIYTDTIIPRRPEQISADAMKKHNEIIDMIGRITEGDKYFAHILALDLALGLLDNHSGTLSPSLRKHLGNLHEKSKSDFSPESTLFHTLIDTYTRNGLLDPNSIYKDRLTLRILHPRILRDRLKFDSEDIPIMLALHGSISHSTSLTSIINSLKRHINNLQPSAREALGKLENEFKISGDRYCHILRGIIYDIEQKKILQNIDTCNNFGTVNLKKIIFKFNTRLKPLNCLTAIEEHYQWYKPFHHLNLWTLAQPQIKEEERVDGEEEERIQQQKVDQNVERERVDERRQGMIVEGNNFSGTPFEESNLRNRQDSISSTVLEKISTLRESRISTILEEQAEYPEDEYAPISEDEEILKKESDIIISPKPIPGMAQRLPPEGAENIIDEINKQFEEHNSALEDTVLLRSSNPDLADASNHASWGSEAANTTSAKIPKSNTESNNKSVETGPFGFLKSSNDDKVSELPTIRIKKAKTNIWAPINFNTLPVTDGEDFDVLQKALWEDGFKYFDSLNTRQAYTSFRYYIDLSERVFRRVPNRRNFCNEMKRLSQNLFLDKANPRHNHLEEKFPFPIKFNANKELSRIRIMQDINTQNQTSLKSVTNILFNTIIENPEHAFDEIVVGLQEAIEEADYLKGPTPVKDICLDLFETIRLNSALIQTLAANWLEEIGPKKCQQYSQDPTPEWSDSLTSSQIDILNVYYSLVDDIHYLEDIYNHYHEFDITPPPALMTQPNQSNTLERFPKFLETAAKMYNVTKTSNCITIRKKD